MLVPKSRTLLANPGPTLIYDLRRFLSNMIQKTKHFIGPNEQREHASISTTAYLDGLRGLAALIVINYHFLFAFTDIPQIGYGYDDKHKSFWALPGVRLIYDGAACVNIFFSISGYVCSYGALRLMTEIATSSDEHEKLLKSRKLATSMAGSVFRRLFRLYLPTLAMSFIITICAYFGMFESVRPYLDQRKLYFPHSSKFSEPQLKRFPTLYGQLAFWANDIWPMLDVFASGPVYPQHDNHFWTIPYEFRLSMHLYVALLALSWCKPLARMVCLIILSIAYFFLNHWEGPLFFLGAALAQCNILTKAKVQSRLPQREPKSEEDRSLTRPKHSRNLLRSFAYVFAIYLMCYPNANGKFPSTGYSHINSLIPTFYKRKEKLPKSVGVLLLLYLLSTSSNHIHAPRPSVLHRLLTCQPLRYLGKHMFSLYLVHGTIFHAVGYGLPHLWWKWFPSQTPTGYFLGVFFGWVWSVVLCLVIANVFTRTIDAKCVKFTKWLEGKLFIKDRL